MHDIVVIGAGPAGSAAARRLALRGRDVALLESTAFDAPRFGETLAPEANPLLRDLGVWERFAASSALESPGTVSAWGSPVPRETDFVANRHGSGRHVDRNAFDALLCGAAADAGARVVTNTSVRRCTRDAGDMWRIETSRGKTLAARFVVDASGRNTVRLGAADGRVVDDSLVGVFLLLAHDEGRPPDLRTLVESTPDGWWYCAPLPSGESAAVFITDPAVYAGDASAVTSRLATAPLTRARIARARIVASDVLAVPSQVRKRAAGDGWAAAGDAAAAYDPLSGYGITKALHGAREVAEAVDRGLDGEPEPLQAYADGVRRAFDAYTVQRREYYALETRWPERVFWKHRAAR